MHPAPEFDVVINGGGPVGMGLAIELGQRGVRVCVIELYPEPQPVPKGQNLTQRTAEHFRAWGCEAELRAAHPLPKDAGIGGMTLYRTLLSEHALDWFNRAAVGEYYFGKNARVPQYKSEAVLRARAAALDTVILRYGWQGTRLSQAEDGVRLTITNTKMAQTEEVRGAYLVGTDGSRSMVREGAGISETRAEHDRLMALLVFNSTELHTLLNRHPGKAIYKVLHPDLQGYWTFFGRVDHGKSWFFHAPVPMGTTADNFDFRAFLHRAVGQEFEFEQTYLGFWNLRIALADRYRKGRVFIAGDAAHSHPPYGGYGINTGLEDARNLGWKLSATLQGWGGAGLLDSYTAERRPVFASTARDFIERYIEKDRKFLKEFNPDKDAAVFDRAWAESQSDTWDVDQFEPNYEGSPIVPGSSGTPSALGHHSFLARPGHLLPPPGPGGDHSIGDLLGPDLTLLAADTACLAAFSDAAGSLGVPLTTVVLPADWKTAYGTDRILLRPDRFVAWDGAEDLPPADIIAASLGGANAPVTAHTRGGK
ncbi:MAG: FAD-dependent monooxygenase [Pseudomonadota bacterium]